MSGYDRNLVTGRVWLQPSQQELYKAIKVYSIGLKKSQMIKDPTTVQQALVLQYRAQQVLNKHWLYSSKPKK